MRSLECILKRVTTSLGQQCIYSKLYLTSRHLQCNNQFRVWLTLGSLLNLKGLYLSLSLLGSFKTLLTYAAIKGKRCKPSLSIPSQRASLQFTFLLSTLLAQTVSLSLNLLRLLQHLIDHISQTLTVCIFYQNQPCYQLFIEIPQDKLIQRLNLAFKAVVLQDEASQLKEKWASPYP